MAKRPSKKADLAAIRAVLQRETVTGVAFDDAVDKAASELPDAFARVTKDKPNA